MQRRPQRISFVQSFIVTTLAAATLLACTSAQAENAAATLLRDALALAATFPGTSTIDLAPVTGQRIELDAPLVIDSDVIIEGRGVTLDGQLKGRVLQVNAGVTATVRQLTVTRGLLAGQGISAGSVTADSGSSLGAGIHNAGQLTLDGVQVQGNYATGGGGGGGVAGSGNGGGGGGSGVRLSDGTGGYLYGTGGSGGQGVAYGGGAGAVTSPGGGLGAMGSAGAAGSGGGGAGGGVDSLNGDGGGAGGWAGAGGGGGKAGGGGGGYGGGGSGSPNGFGGGGGGGGGSNGASGGAGGSNGGSGSGGAGGSPGVGGNGNASGVTRGAGGGHAALGGVWVGGGGGAGSSATGTSGGAAVGGIYNAAGATLAIQGAGCSVTANLAAGGGGGSGQGGGQAVGGVWNGGTLTLAPECEGAITGNQAGAGNSSNAAPAPAVPDAAWPLQLNVADQASVTASAMPAPLTGAIGTCTSPALGATQTCSATYAQGAAVTLTASAPPVGRQLVWSGDCTSASDPLQASVTLSGPRQCSARIEPMAYAIATVAAPLGGGSLDCPATAQHGTVAACTAHPATGYTTQSISGCNGVPTAPGVDGYSTAAVVGACTVTAQFVLIEYTIAASASSGGAIACPATVPHGGSATCSATPEPGFRLDHFTGCNGASGTTCQLTNVQANRAVVAVFAAVPTPAAIPTLSQWSVLLLSALVGLAALRRRDSSQIGR